MIPKNELVLYLLIFFLIHKPYRWKLEEAISEDLRATLSKENS